MQGFSGYGCRPEVELPDDSADLLTTNKHMPRLNEFKCKAIFADLVARPRGWTCATSGVNVLYGDGSAQWVDRGGFDADLQPCTAPDPPSTPTRTASGRCWTAGDGGVALPMAWSGGGVRRGGFVPHAALVLLNRLTRILLTRQTGLSLAWFGFVSAPPYFRDRRSGCESDKCSACADSRVPIEALREKLKPLKRNSCGLDRPTRGRYKGTTGTRPFISGFAYGRRYKGDTTLYFPCGT